MRWLIPQGIYLFGCATRISTILCKITSFSFPIIMQLISPALKMYFKKPDLVQNCILGRLSKMWHTGEGRQLGARFTNSRVDFQLATMTCLTDFPEPYAVRLSHQHPQILDAKFFKPHHTVVDEFAKRNWTDYRSNFVQTQDHLRYKYLLSIDGWAAAWERVQWIMSSNSLLFKQDSRVIQWYSNRIEPGVHYVPFAANLSDLLEKIEYYKKHDEQAQQIVKNANAISKKYLTFEAVLQEYYGLLDQFAHIQNLTISQMDELLASQPQANLFEILELQQQEKIRRYTQLVSSATAKNLTDALAENKDQLKQQIWTQQNSIDQLNQSIRYLTLIIRVLAISLMVVIGGLVLLVRKVLLRLRNRESPKLVQEKQVSNSSQAES